MNTEGFELNDCPVAICELYTKAVLLWLRVEPKDGIINKFDVVVVTVGLQSSTFTVIPVTGTITDHVVRLKVLFPPLTLLMLELVMLNIFNPLLTADCNSLSVYPLKKLNPL